jgi:DNA repair exonuclease SbcCD ATPase subunit
MTNLSFSLIEIIVLMLGAILLGITIHFFIVSRRSPSLSDIASKKVNKSLEEWKLRYFNDIELRDKELSMVKQRLQDSEENSNIYSIEAEEMRKLNNRLQAELDTQRKAPPVLEKPEKSEKPDYFEQLRQAKSSLLEHNEKINQLLGQIDIVKESEEKKQEVLKDNEELAGQIGELKFLLSQKEKEINNVRQKEHLTKEMTSMLDSAYSEFNVLQEKIQKLESQVSSSKRLNLEFEDLKEGHYKLSRDFEEQKLKYNTIAKENEQLQEQYEETENKLREANLQRQQLQKRVAYLEELNNDMQAVADANKKLENQLKRLGELESMLNVVAEERDDLARKQSHSL